MKFTEAQYQEIVKVWESRNGYQQATKVVIETIDRFNNRLELNGDEALALANESTRDWAHEQFVEKEKRYVWYSKAWVVVNKAKLHKRLYRDGEYIRSLMRTKENVTNSWNTLTESEIREWGYDPERFDKEEV